MTATQRQALALLTELVELAPDIRLGQLLAHLGFLGEDECGRTLWDVEDEELVAVLERHRGELRGRAAAAPIAESGNSPAASPAPAGNV